MAGTVARAKGALARPPRDRSCAIFTPLTRSSSGSPAGSRSAGTAFLAATHTDALVILLDGRIVHEPCANGMAAGSRHI